MRISLIIAIFLGVVIIGCSSISKSPVSTVSDESQPSQVNSNSADGIQIIASGTMDLDKGSIEPDSRPTSPYLNVTSIVGKNFSYHINGIVPPDILDITLTINNVSPWTVHDVCIVFEDLYGKTVTNPDSYIDIFGPNDVDPFIAFRKEDPNRAFPPGIDTEQLFLKFPSGSSPLVRYFIIAHIGGNTGGVYELRDWNVNGQLTSGGGSATISVRALDHQNDVTSVIADTTPFTGGSTSLTKSADPEVWEATISNTAHAPAGDYTIMVNSTSPSTPTYKTYNYFTITVSAGTSKIHSVKFVAKPTEDTWYDICVKINGPVYIAADHPATGNTGTKRTAIRFANDLTAMTVLNSGTGLNSGYATPFDKIDVTDGGFVFVNPDIYRQSNWFDTGSANLTPEDVGRELNYCTDIEVSDFYNVNYDGESYCAGVVPFSDCLQAQKSRVWPDSSPFGSWGGGMFLPPNYDYTMIVGIDGVEGTPDAIFFISGTNVGYISRSGDWLTSHAEVLELGTYGAYGTGDGRFKGGLDIALDSNGNIITLEDHGGGSYRFQKIDINMVWKYSCPWSDNGNPMRMDFDRADNKLYLLSSTGVHIMDVQ